MPYCPQCRYEYETGIGKCPDCGVPLVDLLPEESPKTDHEHRYKDWIPVANLTSQQVAEMVLEGLRATDIPAVIYSGVGYFGQAGAMGSRFIPPSAAPIRCWCRRNISRTPTRRGG